MLVTAISLSDVIRQHFCFAKIYSPRELWFVRVVFVCHLPVVILYKCKTNLLKCRTDLIKNDLQYELTRRGSFPHYIATVTALAVAKRLDPVPTVIVVSQN